MAKIVTESLKRIVFPVTEFQVTDKSDPRGTWSGYANTKGFLENNYGSIFADGCYLDSIPQFLKNGFVPDSHAAAQNNEYTVLGSYGYPTVVREDPIGLYFEGTFHSDVEAQTIRCRISERAEAGMSVGMSIGFTTPAGFRIFPKDYLTELPKYLSPQNLKQGMEDAKSWGSILIRTKVGLIENSLTLTPANTESLVTEVQTTMNTKTDTLSKYLGDVDEALALGQVNTLISALYYYVAWSCFCDETIPIDVRREQWAGALQEFMEYNLKVFDAFEASEGTEMNDEGDMMSKIDRAKDFLHSNFTDPKVLQSLRGLASFKQLSTSTLAVVKDNATRIQSLADHRAFKNAINILKGKVISKENYESIKAMRDSLDDEQGAHSKVLKECVKTLDDLLAKHNPDGDVEANTKRISDARALAAKMLKNRITTNLTVH